jgi:hypothetical protein
MRIIFFAFFLGFLSITTLSNRVYAQNSATPVAFNDSKTFKASIRNMAAMEGLDNLGTYAPDTKDVKAKAIRDFQNRFTTVNNAMWYSDQRGLVSYFVKDGFADRVFYDNKGRWEFSLIFFGEDNLPKDIRKAIKSAYFDMTITLVEQVQTIDGIGFVIHLEDKSNIKFVNVNRDAEMTTSLEMTKQ